MIQRIHILGAAGSGTTTLGKTLAEDMGIVHYDIDNYVFESNEKHFTKPRSPLSRDTMLFTDLRNTSSWVLSGAVCGWGDFIIRYFDLVVFLWVPLEERLKRIEEREHELGRKIKNPADPRFLKYNNFMKWASEYDTGDLNMRSLAQHEEWMKKLPFPVLRVEGDKSLDENLAVIVDHIKSNGIGLNQQ